MLEPGKVENGISRCVVAVLERLTEATRRIADVGGERDSLATFEGNPHLTVMEPGGVGNLEEEGGEREQWIGE